MDNRLPLKLRLAVRDFWDSEGSALQVARRQLAETLGCEVRIAPEWAQLLAQLDEAYAGDRQSLVAAVAGSVAVWLRVTRDLMEGADDADAVQQSWLETLLNRLKFSRLECFIEIAKSAGTAWSDSQAAFMIRIPSTPVVVPAELAAAFRGDTLHCFDVESKPKGLKRSRADGEPAAATAAAAADDWADVDIDQATGTAAVVDSTTNTNTVSFKTPCTPKSEYLPTLDSLPRPDALFSRPPYYLSVLDHGLSEIEVHCSHSPSLQLLSEYLTRWCRVNHEDVNEPPAVKVRLHQSCWATGTFHDRLTLVAQNPRMSSMFSLNPAIILAFVEGVLGYDPIQGKTWVFRRDVEFKQ